MPAATATRICVRRGAARQSGSSKRFAAAIGEAGYHWILRAKTGWDGQTGWWVGWVEWPEGPVFFALNIDTPNRLADLDKRQQIGQAVLRTIGALAGD